LTTDLPFVIPSVPGFPISPLSSATTYVVLPKENHMLFIKAAILNRKSAGAERLQFRGRFLEMFYGITVRCLDRKANHPIFAVNTQEAAPQLRP
jgi:hypothetical protein